MFARIGAKILLLAAALAFVFFGVGLLGLAAAAALTALVGVPGAYALTGALLLVLGVIAAMLVLARRSPPPPPPPSGILAALVAAVAKQTPWVAIVGTGLVSLAEMFLASRQSRRKD